MREYSPDLCHEGIISNLKPALSFDENADFNEWRSAVKEKLTGLLGEMPEKVEPETKIELEKEYDDFTEKRFSFLTEKDTRIPCHLLIPRKAKKPCPVVICLQGHSTGMHISLGRPKYEGDEETIGGGDRDFALQIIKEGYAALVVEQRAFGERKSDKIEGKTTCSHPAMVALLIGRTMLGERVWDISRAIDVLSEFEEIDTEKVACMGNSGGGTATYYAACMDERIKAAMPSCSICTYRDSIGAMHHCTCNYIPGIAKYVDMGDLAGLIAPRPLIVVAGKEDNIFPINGVLETFDVIKKIYEKAGTPDNCRLVIGDEGHRFYANPSWDVFRSLTKWE